MVKRFILILVIISLGLSIISNAHNGISDSMLIKSTNAQLENQKNTENEINSFSFLEIAKIIKEILASLAIILGGVFGFFVISRNLKQQTLKDLIAEINQKQRSLNKICREHYDHYYDLLDKEWYIDKEILESLEKSAKEIFKIASNSKKDTANLSYMLKYILVRLNFNYKENKSKIPKEIIGFYLNSVDKIMIKSTKEVVFPSLKDIMRLTQIKRVYKKDLERIAHVDKLKTYSFIETGIDVKPTDALFINYFELVNSYYPITINEAFFRVLRDSIAPVTRLLFLKSIYFPPKIQTDIPSIVGYPKLTISMIGFQEWTTLDDQRNKYYHLYFTTNYENLNPNFYNNIESYKRIENFADLYLSTDLSLYTNLKIEPDRKNDLLIIKIDQEQLHKAFLNHKKQFYDKLKKELKNNS